MWGAMYSCFYLKAGLWLPASFQLESRASPPPHQGRTGNCASTNPPLPVPVLAYLAASPPHLSPKLLGSVAKSCCIV